MGPSRASASVKRLIIEGGAPQPLVLLGVAGGLHRSSAPGDVIVASGLIGGEGEGEITLPEADGVAELLKRERMAVKVGTIVSVSAIVHGDVHRQELATRALAVDMESYWCAPLAQHHPFVVVRVLLDVPGKELRSPAVLTSAREAYRSLKAVARILAQWSPVSVDRYPLLEVGEG
jgi:nucleoside phosphorylase